MSPTESAEMHFRQAAGSALVSKQKTRGLINAASPNPEQYAQFLLADAVSELAQGLSDLAVGLRATYILLEQVKGSAAPRA
jgi:hypothetical protein